MALDPRHLPPEVTAFLLERHLAVLTTLRSDGSPHAVPVGFSWDGETGVARIITGGRSRKVGHVRSGAGGARAVVCQVDGARWLSLEGRAEIRSAPDEVAAAVSRYAARYRQPRPNPERVVIELTIDRILGRG